MELSSDSHVPKYAQIADIIQRDLPFYDASISKKTVDSMNRFAQDLGILSAPVHYRQVVWT